MITKDTSAQMLVLEGVLVAAMIFTTLFFVQGIQTTVYEGVKEENILTEKGNTALNSLDNIPAEGYHTRLIKYIVTNDTFNFSYYISSSIFPSVAYKVYVYNVSAMFSNSTLDVKDYKTLWYELNAPEVGERTQVHRFFVYDGFLYDLVLDMWYL